MGKKLNRIKKTKVHAESKIIKTTKIDDTRKVSFNFRRLHIKKDKFDYKEKDKNYFLKLIERLQNVSLLTKRELETNRSNSLRCHPIDFKECTECGFGLNLSEDIDLKAMQFEISEHAHGRVHGFFITDVFYVVWLDPDHELYSKK